LKPIIHTPFVSLSTLLNSFNTNKDTATDALELSLEAIEGKSPAISQIEVPGESIVPFLIIKQSGHLLACFSDWKLSS
jgi:hypothetical protein